MATQLEKLPKAAFRLLFLKSVNLVSILQVKYGPELRKDT